VDNGCSGTLHLIIWAVGSMNTCKEVIGALTIAITLETYSHVLPDMQRQALELMHESIFCGRLELL
jgi:hypothetical protein